MSALLFSNVLVSFRLLLSFFMNCLFSIDKNVFELYNLLYILSCSHKFHLLGL